MTCTEEKLQLAAELIAQDHGVVVAADTGIGVGSAPAETRPQTRRDELIAVLHCQYIDYVRRFRRRERLKGWVRYTVHHPLASLASMVSKSGLPGEWFREPLCETDWLAKRFLARFRNLPD